MSDNYIFDNMGHKYLMIQTSPVDCLTGDGGMFSLNRSDVSLDCGGTTLSFALRVKNPHWLYINGIPCVEGIMYQTTYGTDGFYYGFYFERLNWSRKIVNTDPIWIISAKGMIAKCIPIPAVIMPTLYT